ncbi:50S ribosomal protein L5 [Marinilabiliaceae bacterium JC040]|nr:50S ribosomal protein L5 [Marinilabiliaceae bacterium JC040]
MSYIPTYKTKYLEEIVPALMTEFGYKSSMQVPRLEKIVINQGIGQAIADKKIAEFSLNELTRISGQKAVQCKSTKDVSNFKLRKGMVIGSTVTLRKTNMYDFLERLIAASLPRIRDFKGVSSKLDGRGNYTLGLEEQIIFPEIVLDEVHKIMGMNITFVTSAETDEEGFALLKHFGIPFKK